MNKRSLALALEAAGLSPEQLAALKAKYATPARRPRVEINTDTCPACGSETLLSGDYACGACSVLKADAPRWFWHYAAEREEGGAGRPRPEKPRPQELPKVERQAEPLPALVALPVAEPVPKAPATRRAFLVTVGIEGRVVVAVDQLRAIEVAHLSRGDGHTASHSVLDMGETLEPETEPELPVRETPALPVERRFKISGPSLEVEVTTLSRP